MSLLFYVGESDGLNRNDAASLLILGFVDGAPWPAAKLLCDSIAADLLHAIYSIAAEVQENVRVVPTPQLGLLCLLG